MRVAQFLVENFVPARAHVRDQKSTFDRFGAKWTPTQLILDSAGKEHHRIEGFLPVDDFLAQLKLGLAKLAFERGDFPEAGQRYGNICREHPASGAAAEACYWAGVAEHKARNEHSPLRETAIFLGEHYPQSEWTRKASVWMG